MSTQKMLVVVLSKTKAVLGAATRVAGGLPAVEDLVGAGLLIRMKDDEETVTVPVEELEVKEVDYSDNVFHDPAAHTVDDTGIIVAPSLRIQSVNPTNAIVTVKVQTGPVPADKVVLVVIDAGPNHAPLKFFSTTTLNDLETKVPISGVPQGDRVVLASVDGYASSRVIFNFT